MRGVIYTGFKPAIRVRRVSLQCASIIQNTDQWEAIGNLMVPLNAEISLTIWRTLAILQGPSSYRQLVCSLHCLDRDAVELRVNNMLTLPSVTVVLLNSWCRVLLGKLTGLQLVKKFPAFHGTRRFITALTSVRHLSLSRASPIQSIYTHPTSWRSILILSTHLSLGLPSGLFPSGFPTKTLYTPLSSPIRATCPAHLIILDFITRTILGEEYRPFSSSLCNLLHSPVTSSFLGPNILFNTILTVVLGLHNCASQLWWRHIRKPNYSVLTKQAINGQQREEFGM